jgi:methylase of polypeptide subunit release factors
MAFWNAASGGRIPDTERLPGRALEELAPRLAARPRAAWEWVERLQETRVVPATGARARQRGAVATPAPIAARMARALLRGVPRGTEWRVLDAGCGSGRLLAAVLRAATTTGVRVACEGVEVDAAAARWAAALEPVVRAGARATLLRWSVRCADFLLENRDGAPFDAVIANPPYVPWRDLDASYRARLVAHGAPARGDLSALFVGALLDRLAPGGRLCVIVPNKLLAAGYAAALRRRLAAETCVEEIWDLSGERVFPGHGSYPVVLVLRRAAAAGRHRVAVREADGRVRARLPQRLWRELPDGIVPLAMPAELLPLGLELLAGKHLGDAVEVRCGIATSGFGRAVGAGPERIIRSGDIRPFGLAGAARFSPVRAGISRQTVRRQRVPKVVVPGMFRRLCAAYEGEGRLVGRVYYVPITGATAAERARHRAALLALLNSRLYALLYAGLFGAVSQSGGYTRLNGPYLRCLPWPRRPPGEELEAVVRAMEAATDAAARTGARQRLDETVESWFEIAPGQRTILARLAEALPDPAKVPDAGRSQRGGRALPKNRRRHATA